MFLTKRPAAIAIDSRFAATWERPRSSMSVSFFTCSDVSGLKSFISTNVMMGFGCFDASNGGPGGGVCAKTTIELKVIARNVAIRNMVNIIIVRRQHLMQ